MYPLRNLKTLSNRIQYNLAEVSLIPFREAQWKICSKGNKQIKSFVPTVTSQGTRKKISSILCLLIMRMRNKQKSKIQKLKVQMKD